MAGEDYLIPIFLINGQLESGKTTFISELIKMGQFDSAKKETSDRLRGRRNRVR